MGREATPSAAIIDSQSVKTTEKGAPRGYDDAGKKVSGRKRHIVVDTTGLLLAAEVHSPRHPGPGRGQVGAGEVAEPVPPAASHLG